MIFSSVSNKAKKILCQIFFSIYVKKVCRVRVWKHVLVKKKYDKGVFMKIIIPFKVYNGFLQNTDFYFLDLYGFIDLESNIVYDVEFDFVYRLDNESCYFLVQQPDTGEYTVITSEGSIGTIADDEIRRVLPYREGVALIESDERVFLYNYIDDKEVEEEIDENLVKKEVFNLFELPKDEEIKDFTKDYVILRNKYLERRIYNNEGKLIFDPYIHYKKYLETNFIKQLDDFEYFLKNLDKLSREGFLSYLKKLDNKHISCLYYYTELGYTQVSKRVFEKLDSSLSERLKFLVLREYKVYRGFFEKNFSEYILEEFESPLDGLKIHIFPKKFENLEKNMANEKSVLFDFELTSMEIAERDVLAYKKKAEELLEIARKSGILPLEFFEDAELYPHLNKLIALVVDGISFDDSFFILFMKKCRDAELEKLSNYYDLLLFYISIFKKGRHWSYINYLLDAHGMEKIEYSSYGVTTKTLKKHLETMLSAHGIYDKHNFNNVIEFIKFIHIGVNYLDDYYRFIPVSVFDDRPSTVFDYAIQGIDKLKLTSELRQLAHIVINYDIDEVEGFEALLMANKKKEQEKINEIFDIIYSFMVDLLKGNEKLTFRKMDDNFAG